MIDKPSARKPHPKIKLSCGFAAFPTPAFGDGSKYESVAGCWQWLRSPNPRQAADCKQYARAAIFCRI
jgi:hypothetical protein